MLSSGPDLLQNHGDVRDVIVGCFANDWFVYAGRGGGVGNSPADRAAKEACLRQSAQERHWQDYAASLQ